MNFNYFNCNGCAVKTVALLGFGSCTVVRVSAVPSKLHWYVPMASAPDVAAGPDTSVKVS